MSKTIMYGISENMFHWMPTVYWGETKAACAEAASELLEYKIEDDGHQKSHVFKIKFRLYSPSFYRYRWSDNPKDPDGYTEAQAKKDVYERIFQDVVNGRYSGYIAVKVVNP